MMLLWIHLVYLVCAVSAQSRVPGVNPKRYQQLHHKNDGKQHQNDPKQSKHNMEPQHVVFEEDIDHIKEHLDVPGMDPKDMTKDQLMFHQFKLMDVDNNGKIDGIELYQMSMHHHDSNTPHINQASDGMISSIVDNVMKYDINEDGYIDFPEMKKLVNRQTGGTDKDL